MKQPTGPDSFQDDLRDTDHVTSAGQETAATHGYEARRCHVCRCKYPRFGFGPPLTRNNGTIWACGTHRVKVNQMLAGESAIAVGSARERLV